MKGIELIRRMTCKSKPAGGKFERFKSVDTRDCQVIAYIDTTSSFGTKMRIEKVRGNMKGATVNCLRHLYFGEKMTFRRGQVVSYRSKFRSETANVAQFSIKKVKGGFKLFLVDTKGSV